MVFCDNCGRQLLGGNNVCESCGFVVNDAPSAGQYIQNRHTGIHTAGDLNNGRNVVNEYPVRQYDVREKMNSGKATGFGQLEPEPYLGGGQRKYGYAQPYEQSYQPTNIRRNDGFGDSPYVHPRRPVVVKKGFGSLIALSCILLFIIVVLPMYNRGLSGELFPSDASVYFTDILEIIDKSKSGLLESDPVLVTVVAGVLGFMMFVFSITKIKTMCVITSFLGLAGMSFVTLIYLDKIGPEKLFAIEKTPICIGFWAVYLVFFVSFIVSWTTRKVKYYV